LKDDVSLCSVNPGKTKKDLEDGESKLYKNYCLAGAMVWTGKFQFKVNFPTENIFTEHDYQTDKWCLVWTWDGACE